MPMLATSANSIGVPRRKTTSSAADAARQWNACPPSCSSVSTSCCIPAAFMKMNGCRDSCSVAWYPPGCFPLRLPRSKWSRARSDSKSSASAADSRPKIAFVPSTSRPVSCPANGASAPRFRGSTSVSHGRSTSSPSASRRRRSSSFTTGTHRRAITSANAAQSSGL